VISCLDFERWISWDEKSELPLVKWFKDEALVGLLGERDEGWIWIVARSLLLEDVWEGCMDRGRSGNCELEKFFFNDLSIV